MPDPALALFTFFLLAAAALALFLPRRGLLQRWQRQRRMTQRVLAEDALKHIQHCESENRKATLHSMAGALQITTDRAAETLARLATRGLVRDEEGGYALTSNGREYALRVIRAHRLWERYLADETGFEAESWHTLAEEQEHRLSPQEIDALAAQLGHPIHDPHGDPIPNAMGEMALPRGRPLAEMPAGQRAVIIHLEDEPESIYTRLLAKGLFAGMEILLLASDSHSVRFRANGDEHRLAPLLARNVTVIPVAEPAEEPPSARPLTALQPGETARVLGISPLIRGVERRRLLDLGILPGTAISAELRSPGGDPTAYQVRGALIALRADQASLIRVTAPEPATHGR